MKSIVYSIKRGQHRYRENRLKIRFYGVSLKQLLSMYGIQLLFLFVFILGSVLGSLSFKSTDSGVLEKLDFLFLSDLDSRLEFSAFELFSSSFASSFLFILSAFLLSFTAWGMFALPFLCAFRGYCTGLSSAYMFSYYGITGIGFYILVVLPGTVLFLFAFILSLKEAFSQSVCLSKSYFSSTYDGLLLKRTKTYLFRNCVILIFAAFSAVIDMILFLLFADMFNF